MSGEDPQTAWPWSHEEVSWHELGSVGPRAPHMKIRAHHDLGPGGSVHQDFLRAHSLRAPQRWHRVPAVALAASGAVVAVTVVIAGTVLGSVWISAAGFTVLAAIAGVVLRGARRRPTAEQRLLDLARAERRIAAELDPLVASGWLVLHDRVLPEGEHRLAHIAVGPAGILLVSPVPATGPLRVTGSLTEHGDDRQLYAGQLPLQVWLRTRRWEIEQLETAISGALQDQVWSGPTAAIVVDVAPAASWRRPGRAGRQRQLPPEWDGIEFRQLPMLVETLVGLPAPLDRATVAALGGVIEQLCPPAGRPESAPHTPQH